MEKQEKIEAIYQIIIAQWDPNELTYDDFVGILDRAKNEVLITYLGMHLRARLAEFGFDIREPEERD